MVALAESLVGKDPFGGNHDLLPASFAFPLFSFPESPY
jgi:hypothetical protein